MCCIRSIDLCAIDALMIRAHSPAHWLIWFPWQRRTFAKQVSDEAATVAAALLLRNFWVSSHVSSRVIPTQVAVPVGNEREQNNQSASQVIQSQRGPRESTTSDINHVGNQPPRESTTSGINNLGNHQPGESTNSGINHLGIQP